MLRFPSKCTHTELLDKWDEYTSPARFAGNDETMDLVFVSKRKGNKVRLVRKARSAFEPFSCVFRGEIKPTDNGSEIVGFFTKGLIDYSLVGLLLMFLFYLRSIIIERGGSLATVNSLLAVALVGSLLLLMNFRTVKRKYSEFICRITGEENHLFLSKKEMKEKEEQ